MCLGVPFKLFTRCIKQTHKQTNKQTHKQKIVCRSKGFISETYEQMLIKPDTVDLHNSSTANFVECSSKFASVLMFRAVFWVVLPCKMIVDRRFRGAYCLHHQGWCLCFALMFNKTSFSSKWLIVQKLVDWFQVLTAANMNMLRSGLADTEWRFRHALIMETVHLQTYLRFLKTDTLAI
jgi:hypothetical protein